jgi:hypothetical protein
MARIKIKDLPDDMKISQEMMKKIYGGPNRRAHDHIGTFLGYDMVLDLGIADNFLDKK